MIDGQRAIEALLPKLTQIHTCERLAGGALGVGVGSRQHKVKVGHTTVGDPHLLTVDDPLVALLLGLGLDASHVGAGSGLCMEIVKSYFSLIFQSSIKFEKEGKQLRPIT